MKNRAFACLVVGLAVFMGSCGGGGSGGGGSGNSNTSATPPPSSQPQTPIPAALGTTWTTRIAGYGATNGYLRDVTWGGSGYVAGGYDNNGNTIFYTSSDGLQWDLQNLGLIHFEIESIAWTGNEYIAGGLARVGTTANGNPLYGPEFLVSTNGTSWSPRSATWDGQSIVGGDLADKITSVAASGQSLVAIRRGIIYSSTDGVAWTSHGLAGSSRVVWNSDRYVIAVNDQTLSGMQTSPDGVAWTSQLTLINNDGTFGLSLQDATWSGNQYVAVGFQGPLGTSTWGLVANSVTGASWNSAIWQSGFFTGLTRVIWDGTQFLAIGSYTGSLAVNGTADAVLTSPDGFDWTVAYIGSTFHQLRNVAASPTGYAAVGTDGAIITAP